MMMRSQSSLERRGCRDAFIEKPRASATTDMHQCKYTPKNIGRMAGGSRDSNYWRSAASVLKVARVCVSVDIYRFCPPPPIDIMQHHAKAFSGIRELCSTRQMHVRAAAGWFLHSLNQDNDTSEVNKHPMMQLLVTATHTSRRHSGRSHSTGAPIHVEEREKRKKRAEFSSDLSTEAATDNSSERASQGRCCEDF